MLRLPLFTQTGVMWFGIFCEHRQNRGLDAGRIGRRLCCDADERTGERDDERLDG